MTRAITVLVIGFTVFASQLQGQVLEQVAAEREAKLEEALGELRGLREQIKEERLPLVRELNQLDEKVSALDRKVTRVRRLRDNESVELETLQARVGGRQKEVDYLTSTLLPAFVANFDAALTAGERETAGEEIRAYNLFLETADVSEEEKLERGLALMSDSLARVDDLLGGRRFPGEALAPDETILPGQFLEIGPIAYFAPDGGDQLAGRVVVTNGFTPRMEPLGKNGATLIATVARTGAGSLPIDPTLGDAFAVEQARDTFTEHLAKGGIWVYPILLFALVATLVAIVKSIQVFTIRHPQPMVIHDIITSLRKGDVKHARELAKAQPQPARDMLAAAVDHAAESTEMVEEVMYECMLTTQPKLERFLNVIAVTAATAPLLGLLGTVTGIIKTFRLMTIFGAGDPKPLISGISEALITTELGLVLAIPALILHAILSRKVAGTMARMEKTAVTFVNGLSRRQTAETSAK